MKKLDEIKLQPGLLVCQFGITFGGLKLCLKKIKSEISSIRVGIQRQGACVRA